MGVIHKLKKEIIDFIIEEKKKNPGLGCRSLADLVGKKFQITVSKSAINEILKSANLSSPIGRRSGGERKIPKFEIPSLKKEQLLSQLPVVPSSSPPPEPTLKQDAVKFEKPASVEEKFQPSRRESSDPKAVSDLPPPLISCGVASDPVFKGPLLDGMGAMFLKAAEWCLSGSDSMLGNMLKKHAPTDLRNINALSDILLFLSVFDLENLQQLKLYQGEGLWQINGQENKISEDEIFRLMQGVSDGKNLSLRMANEIPQVFSEILFIKITLADRTEILLDAQHKSIWNNNVHSGHCLPLNKVINEVTKKLITNVHFVIIESIADQGFSENVLAFIAAFENLEGKKIKSIGLYRDHNEEVAQFGFIPGKKRFFILGARPEQKEADVFSSERDMEGCIFTPLGEKVYFLQKEVEIRGNNSAPPLPKLKMIGLKKEESKSMERVLFSNLSEPPAEIAARYLARWPNSLAKNAVHGPVSEPEPVEMTTVYKNLLKEIEDAYLQGENLSVWDNVQNLLFSLNLYCRRRFFRGNSLNLGITAMKERFYRLPGYLEKKNGYLLVKLLPPAGYVYHEELDFALKNLNELDIRNGSGLKLLMSA